MLEQTRLLLGHWGPDGMRAIVAADTGQPQGFACWRSRAGLSWWRRLGRPVLEVHEQEDQPLLFTVRRCWTLWTSYEVCDADDRHVGYVLGATLYDRSGRKLAVRRASETGTLFQDPTGLPLARWESGPESDVFAFLPEVQDNPFSKMVLLAAVLQG
jgi:hypothetical protein